MYARRDKPPASDLRTETNATVQVSYVLADKTRFREERKQEERQLVSETFTGGARVGASTVQTITAESCANLHGRPDLIRID
jgi:hypothetical protein